MKYLFLIVLLTISTVINASSLKYKVEQYIKSYNQHNVEKMLKQVTPDIKWFTYLDNQLLIETEDKAALRIAMNQHFSHNNKARSKLRKSITLGSTIVAVEEAFLKDGNKSQCALSIYQFEQDLIASVIYHSPSACPSN